MGQLKKKKIIKSTMRVTSHLFCPKAMLEAPIGVVAFTVSMPGDRNSTNSRLMLEIAVELNRYIKQVNNLLISSRHVEVK